MRIYVSFVDQDRDLVDELEVHLKPMQRAGKLSFWHRGKAVLTSPLAEQMERELAMADLVLAFVSPRYNASDDRERELRAAVDAGKRPIPILAEAAPLNDTYFDGKVSLPRDNKPLARRRDLDAALVTIVEEIRGIMDTMGAPRPAPAPAPPPWLLSNGSPSRAPAAPWPPPDAPQKLPAWSILEIVPFPWSDPRTLALRDNLIRAYPDAQRARALAQQAGVIDTAINWNQSAMQIWHDLLDVAASSGALVPLVTRVLSDRLSTAYWDGIRTAILPLTLP